MRKIFLSLVVMLTFFAGQALGKTYTITFATGTDTGTEMTASTAISDVVSAGADYISAFTTYTKAYYASTNGIKLGSSSAIGEIAFTLASSINNVTSITVKSAHYGSDIGALNLTVDGTKLNTEDIIPGVDFPYTYSTPTNISSIKLATTAKRAYVSEIIITTQEAGKTTTTTTFPQGSYSVYKTEGFTAPTATVKAGETEVSDAVVTYASNNTDVATVDASTGAVTLVAAGTAKITASYAGDDTYDESTASYTLTVGNAYASLADLVAAGAPTATGVQTKLTLTNEKIHSIAKNAAGTSRLGVWLKSGDQEVELYLSGVPETWADNGTLTGTVEGSWLLYNKTTWELKLNTGAWDNLTYAEPVYAFKATENIGTTKAPVYKEIISKFTKSPLTVTYKDATDGLTFKVNGEEVTLAHDTVAVLKHTIATKNETDLVQVYNGETLVAEQSFTWIPTVNISGYKTLEDGTEAVLTLNDSKVTYVSTDGSTIYFEDASKGIQGYNLGLVTTPTAYTGIKSGSIWGVKKTYTNIVEITAVDSTAICSSIEQNTTVVTPTALTVDKAYGDAAQQLRYAKFSGVKLQRKNGQFVVFGDTCNITVYDKYQTKAMAELSKDTLTYADLTALVGITSKGAVQLWPLALENIADKIAGTCGTVTWTIDMSGNMVFAPTDGTSGTLAQTGTAASKRPWDAVKTAVKTVKFDAGVSAASDNSYMFKDMTNLKSVDFTNFNTSAMTTMKGLFNGCSSLKSVDMSMLDIAKVTTLNLTFNGCSALESVNFGDNTLAAVTDFTSAFYSCHALKALDFSKVPGTAVTKMATMLYDCTALETVDLSNFSTAKVSSASNAKNVFGAGAYAALPTTLKISKNFGRVATGDYVALPGVPYKATDPVKAFSKQSDLYAYNETLTDFGTYEALNRIATLDEETLEANTVKQYAVEQGYTSFTSGGYTLQNYNSTSSWGTYYYAFTLSNKTTKTEGASYDNPYESACGGAMTGQNYVVWYDNTYNGGDTITLAKADPVTGFYVTNTTYTEDVIKNGNYAARKLNKEGDNLILHINGYDADGHSTGTVDYTLASTTGNKLSYVKAWRWVDLTSLGATTKYLTFSMTGTDAGQYGLNTPTYFAMDDLGGFAPETDEALEVYEFTTTGIDNADADVNANVKDGKYIKNGRIVIIKNGKLFNAAGQIMK